MDQNVAQLIRSVEIELKSMADRAPRLEDLRAVDAQVRELRDQVVALRAVLDQATAALNPKQVQDSIGSLSKSIEAVDRKLPPMTNIVAAAVVAFGLLGWQFYDLRQARSQLAEMKKPIDEATSQVNAAATSLKGISAETQSVTAGLKSDLTSLKAALGDATGNLGRLDKSVARLLSDVANLPLPSAGIPARPTAVEPTDSGGDILEDLLLNSDQAPLYMVLAAKAKQAIKAGDYAEARSRATKAKALDPDKHDAFYDSLIAVSFQREDRYREAIGAYENGLERDPKNIALINNLGSAYFSMALHSESPEEKHELLAKSIESHRRGVEVDNTDNTNTANLATSLLADGRPQEALEALARIPLGASQEVDLVRAAIHCRLNQVSDAVSALKTVIVNRDLARHVLLDSDFVPLRTEPSFLSMMEKAVGARTLDQAKQLWARKDAGERK